MKVMVIIIFLGFLTSAGAAQKIVFPEEVEKTQNDVSQKNFPYISDDHYDTREEFLSGALGRDCDDYSFEKARRLHDLGYKLERLEIWAVIYKENCCEYKHAVLVIDEKIVLDNREKEPYLVSKAKWKLDYKIKLTEVNKKLLE